MAKPVKTPVISGARFVRGLWTTNPQYTETGNLQHPGPLIGWTPPDAEGYQAPVYGRSEESSSGGGMWGKFKRIFRGD